MRVLVTGATGFIGGRTAQRLLERGDAVRVLARRPEAAAHLVGAEVVRGDLTDPSTFPAALEGVDAVIHCAGLSADWAPREDFEAINVTGTIALARAAAGTASRPHFLHVSTSDVYGYPVGACGDDAEPRDVGLPYNSSKLRGERGVCAVPGLRWTVFRPATVYGPGAKDWGTELARLLASRSMAVVDDGQVGAGMLYVDNLIDAFFAALERPATLGRAYTLRDEQTVTWRTWVDGIADGLGLPRVTTSLPEWLAYGIAAGSEAVWATLRIRSRPVLTRHVVRLMSRSQDYGIDRAVRELGFSSRVPFDEGLRRTVAWLRETAARP